MLSTIVTAVRDVQAAVVVDGAPAGTLLAAAAMIEFIDMEGCRQWIAAKMESQTTP